MYLDAGVLDVLLRCEALAVVGVVVPLHLTPQPQQRSTNNIRH